MIDKFKIGTYVLGFYNVDVWADPKEAGGNFTCRPVEGGVPKIVVGFDYHEAEYSFGVLVHEALELMLCDHSCRMVPKNFYADSASDVYTFVFDHSQMTDIANKLAWFLWSIKKDFEAAFELVLEERKRK